MPIAELDKQLTDSSSMSDMKMSWCEGDDMNATKPFLM